MDVQFIAAPTIVENPHLHEEIKNFTPNGRISVGMTGKILLGLYFLMGLNLRGDNLIL